MNLGDGVRGSFFQNAPPNPVPLVHHRKEIYLTPEEAYKIFLKTNHMMVLSVVVHDDLDRYYFVPMQCDPFMERWSVDINTGNVEFVPGYKYPHLGPYKKDSDGKEVPYKVVFFDEINRKEFPEIMEELDSMTKSTSTTVYETF